MRNKYVKLTAIFLGTVLTAVLIYLGFNMENNQVNSMKVDNFEGYLVELETEQEILDEEISKLYVDNNQTYIIKSLKEERIAEIEESVLTFDENLANLNKELYDLSSRDQKKYTKKMDTRDINDSLKNYYISIQDLRAKRELTDLINSLFSTEYIEDAEIDSEVYIATDLNTEKLEKVATRTAKRIKGSVELNLEEYSKAIASGLEIAGKQLADFNQAIELRNELFNENGFLVEIDNEKIKEFWSAVEKIKNPEIQSSFDDYLRIAEAYELEELEDESEDTDELDYTDSEEREESGYQRPSSIGGASGSSTGGSSSSSTGGTSSGSTSGSSSGSSSSGSTSGSSGSSTGSSSSGSTSGSTDKPTGGSSDSSSSGSDDEPTGDSSNDSSSGSDDEATDDSSNGSSSGSADESTDGSDNGSGNGSNDESPDDSTSGDAVG